MSDPRFMPLLRILLVNGSTLYGIFMLHWGVFALVYAFWWDLFIESIFIWLKMRLATAPYDFSSIEMTVKINGRTLDADELNQNPQQISWFYLQSKLFMLFIYWVFIQIMGLGSTAVDENLTWFEDWVSITIFFNKPFYIAVLFVFASHLQDFIHYHKHEIYKKVSKKEFFNVFDSKTIFIHVYIIAAFGLYFLFDRNFPTYKYLIVPISGGVFVGVKTMISLLKLKNSPKNLTEINNV